MNPPSLAAAALFAACLAGCGGGNNGSDAGDDVGIDTHRDAFDVTADIPGDVPSEVGSAWIEVGGGESTFVALHDGDSVDVIRGPQGGYHITGAWRGAGFQPRFFTMNFDIRLGDELVGHVGYIDNFEGDDEPWEYLSATVFIGDWVDPASLDGETLRLSILVEDRDGLLLYDEVSVVADCCIETLIP